jgi:hypothetical protein
MECRHLLHRAVRGFGGGRLRTDACPRSEANGTRRAVTSHGSRGRAWLHRQQAFTLQLLAGEFAGAANRLRFLPGSSLGRLFVMTAQLHLAKDPSRCIFFFKTLRAWSILLSRTRTCTRPWLRSLVHSQHRHAPHSPLVQSNSVLPAADCSS